MRARLKNDSRIGEVVRVYTVTLDDGSPQKRIEVKYAHGSIDASVDAFDFDIQFNVEANARRNSLN